MSRKVIALVVVNVNVNRNVTIRRATATATIVTTMMSVALKFLFVVSLLMTSRSATTTAAAAAAVSSATAVSSDSNNNNNNNNNNNYNYNYHSVTGTGTGIEPSDHSQRQQQQQQLLRHGQERQLQSSPSLVSRQTNRTSTFRASAASTGTTSTNSYYYKVTDFGKTNNYDVTLGNPHRGLASAPYLYDSDKSGVKHSIEVDYVRLDTILIGYNKTNWTLFEQQLVAIASRYVHYVPRLHIHFPGNPLALPPYLLSGPKQAGTFWYTDMGGGLTPNYGDKNLLEAIEYTIKDFGKKYDGDHRIHAIQIGTLGFWGEWHTGSNPDHAIPDSTKNLVLKWFYDSFQITPIQARYPNLVAYQYKFGFHDDSFTWYTLDGVYDNNSNEWFYFQRQVQDLKVSDFWKYGPMGGEVRPENVDQVFESNYPAGKEKNKQDFYFCSQLTHSTYSKVGSIFANLYMGSDEIYKANWNSARMGYAYQIRSVGFKKSTTTPPKKKRTSSTTKSTTRYVDIDIVLENIGIAPIYFPTQLVVTCKDIIKSPHTVNGVDKLIDQYSYQTFQFRGIPASLSCFQNISISFASNYTYPQRPIKFAQGDTGFIHLLNVPSPPI